MFTTGIRVEVPKRWASNVNWMSFFFPTHSHATYTNESTSELSAEADTMRATIFGTSNANAENKLRKIISLLPHCEKNNESTSQKTVISKSCCHNVRKILSFHKINSVRFSIYLFVRGDWAKLFICTPFSLFRLFCYHKHFLKWIQLAEQRALCASETVSTRKFLAAMHRVMCTQSLFLSTRH